VTSQRKPSDQLRESHARDGGRRVRRRERARRVQKIKASAGKVDSQTGAMLEAATEEGGTAGERSSKVHVEGSGVKGQRTLAEFVGRRRRVY
jgi:hypothetical protein